MNFLSTEGRCVSGTIDRLIFVCLYRLLPGVRDALAIVKPETVVKWHRAGFRLYWRWKSISAGRQANISVGDPQAYSRDEHGQSAVGSASDPWRVAQARRRYRTDQRGQVHGQATRAAVPRLEHSSTTIGFSASTLLRIGVALLGVRITLTQITALGVLPVAMVVLSVAMTIAIGILLARLLGYRRRFGVLTGGAVAICGASAAMAIAAVISVRSKDNIKERATIFTVIGVSTLSTIAMVIYPIIVTVLGLTP
jgi:hypothetical protein